MIRTPLWIVAAVLAVGLAACAEKAQTATARKADSKAWSGTNDGYAVPGWKAGDQASWDDQLRKRAQNQNEYTRTAAGGK